MPHKRTENEGTSLEFSPAAGTAAEQAVNRGDREETGSQDPHVSQAGLAI